MSDEQERDEKVRDALYPLLVSCSNTVRQEKQAQVEFARQLATLNAQPERWALVEIYMLVMSEIVRLEENASDTACYVYTIVGAALSQFGFGGVDLDDTRALLAARERQATEPVCHECGRSLTGKGRIFGLCDSCLREAIDGSMEYRAEMTAAAKRKADEARRERYKNSHKFDVQDIPF